MRPSSKLSLPASVAVLLLGLALLGTSTASSSPQAHSAVAGGARPSLGKGSTGEIGGGPVRARQQRHPRDLKGATHSGSDPRTGTLSKTVNAGQPVTLKLLVTGGTGLRVRWTLADPAGCESNAAPPSGRRQRHCILDARSARDPEPAAVSAKLTSFWDVGRAVHQPRRWRQRW